MKQRGKAVSPYVQALFDAALAAHLQGDVAAAERQYQAILAQAPEHADSWHALGVLADGLGRHDVALDYIRRAIAISGRVAVYHNDLGNALKNVGAAEQAMASYRRALAIAPDFATHNNLGLALKDRGELDEAVRQYRLALALQPDSAQVHNNLGLALKDQGKLEEALAEYERALELLPDYAEARWNKGFMALLRGDLLAGWEGNEWRGRLRGNKMLPMTAPLWDGGELAGRTILLCHEQGLGDTLQFVRYAPMVKARGGKVILWCQPPLASLLRDMDGVDAVVTTLPPPADFDCYAPLMSLPGIFATTLTTIPASVPYVPTIDLQDGVARWREKLPAASPKIGIVWRGSATHTNDHNRSIAAKDFKNFLEDSTAHFISLQKEATAAELAALRTNAPSLFDSAPLLGDFADTASLLLALDLVLTVDTSVAHLAGALGVPVWLLVPFAPDWRWLLERADSPWYPTMRLFRQARPGDWRPVIAAVRRALSA